MTSLQEKCGKMRLYEEASAMETVSVMPVSLVSSLGFKAGKYSESLCINDA
jgi:ABC-type transporter Mla maintaining outer membrane lipid asymmetry permease subunit MlaE